MNWEKEYEHLRDRGKTWGPGIDDVEEPTEEEIARHEAQMAAYRQKLEEYSVAPREAFVNAAKELDSAFPGKYDCWKKEYQEKKISFCQEACSSLGYSMDLGWLRDHRDANQAKDTFSISVEYFGWLPGNGGNIHKFFVCGIDDVEDCLQLVADFKAIGSTPTTWYGEHFHYTSGNTGELRMELIRRYGIGEPAGAKQQDISHDSATLDETLKSAISRSGRGATVNERTEEIEKE